MIARSDLDLSQSNTVESLKTKLESAGVEFVFAAYVDVHGVPKAKCVPIRQFDEMCGGSELYTVGAVEGMGLAGPHEDECCTTSPRRAFHLAPIGTQVHLGHGQWL